MSFSQRVPLPNQPENYLIDENLWHQNYSIQKADLPDHLDTPEDLWGDGDRVKYSQITNGIYNIE